MVRRVSLRHDFLGKSERKREQEEEERERGRIRTGDDFNAAATTDPSALMAARFSFSRIFFFSIFIIVSPTSSTSVSRSVDAALSRSKFTEEEQKM